MDKYQEFALKNTRYLVYEDEKLEKKCTSGDKWLCVAEGITVTQNENYNITKYFIRFDDKRIRSVTFNGKTYEKQDIWDGSDSSIIVPVDFNNKITEAIINYSVVDPIQVKINYVDADKDAFDKKVAKENQDKLVENAKIKISTGADLVNIYFVPCCENYSRTEIELYLAIGNYERTGGGVAYRPRLISATPEQLIGKFKVEEGMMFKSITGLARHPYCVVVIQYDNNDNVLFKTDYMKFEII